MTYHYHIGYFAGHAQNEHKEAFLDFKFRIRTKSEVEMVKEKLRETESLRCIHITGISLLWEEQEKKKPTRGQYSRPTNIHNKS